MVEKKYILKNEVQRFDDGTNNDEHIKDIIKKAEMLYDNIQDNNDICIQIYNDRKNKKVDEDVLDALQIACQNSIEIEKQAGEIMQAIEKYASQLDRTSQPALETLLNQTIILEKKSKKIMESALSI
ncbi:MAG: hypothetical protein E7379_04595 [Clostridiales bacterium]|nr:hypothetical protein [Clostridiales bacterium]